MVAVSLKNLHAGIAGGADIILLPEIPYSVDKIAAALLKRERQGKNFSIIAVAEGAISVADAALSKKERKAKAAQSPYPSKAYELADELGKETGQEIRICVPGHIQRGGSPCPYDRVLSTRLGAAAARLVKEEKFGFMVAVKGAEIKPVPLGEVAGKLKFVPDSCGLIQTARDMDVSFGDGE